ncbi:hypothetical protein OPIT5_23775 [Opitutaceae bacterium TAV5]|nr:hypothetical protein OPIT5_23775 [Opitutaceae bacterium TAV5]
MVEHHVRLGVSGMMLAGTCGEGPWMKAEDTVELVRTAVEANRGRMAIAVQVTDNSPRRILRNIEQVAAAGAEVAVVASPYFLMNATSDRILAFYRTVIRNSALPVGFYDRGKHGSCQVSLPHLAGLLAEPNLVMVKDSSADPGRRAAALAVKQERPELVLFNGDEFDCVTCLEEGLDGLLLGGGIFNARLARQILDAVRAGDGAAARAAQARMTDLMFRVYGGPKIECWLTGLKYLLVRLGVFSGIASHLGYPLTETCRRAIDEAISGEFSGTLITEKPEEIMA